MNDHRMLMLDLYGAAFVLGCTLGLIALAIQRAHRARVDQYAHSRTHAEQLDHLKQELGAMATRTRHAEEAVDHIRARARERGVPDAELDQLTEPPEPTDD